MIAAVITGFETVLKANLPTEFVAAAVYYSYSDLLDDRGNLRSDLPDNFLVIDIPVVSPDVQHDADVRDTTLFFQLTIGSIKRSVTLASLEHFYEALSLPPHRYYPLASGQLNKLGKFFTMSQRYKEVF